ncbi:AraC-like ligand binding domain-containing protein [Paramicrobacterium humi]|uniref:AraC-like ligand binding domain-containing protein n=1 Tax=Paramicrobacterium humi TaxID=640635 RepID=A0A1H4KXK1_9MICO|nr:AraC family transcriptional regulator [Microbacterium humi]SEB62858.1 AraC-like ligand binding domain-containing protein [Microbacterium humi]
MLLRDGFPGQRFRVLARPTVDVARKSPVTKRFLVTDAGYFPHAAAHGRIRPRGAAETIVIICTGGSGRLTVDGIEYVVTADDAAIIPARSAHQYIADVEDPWSIWWLHATGPDADELARVIIGAGNDPVLRLRDTRSATSLVERVIDTLEIDDTSATLLDAAGLAWQLFAHLAADRLRGHADPSDRIKEVQDYLRANLTSNLTVPELARMAAVSSSHFSALFKSSTGMTVTEYIKRLRSARARELLMTTSATIAEVGERVGYADAFYFSRQFRSVNGISPRDFRRHVMRDAL